MKIKFIGIAVAVIIVASGNTMAKEAPPLNPGQEDALRNFAVSLLTPPNVLFKVTLKPPITTYRAEFAKEDYDQLNQRVREVFAAGKFGDDTVAYIQMSWIEPYVREWKPSISCGTWQDSNFVGAKQWSHPDTQPGGCPHDQGTSHPGTVVAIGDYEITLHTSGNDNQSIELLKANISFTCTYEGSESGVGQCEESIKSWSGRYAPNSSGLDFGSTQIIIISIIVGGAVVATVRILVRRRKSQ